MHIILSSAIIINILAIAILLIGLFYNFKQPKNKAIYGYYVVGSMIMYIAIICVVSLCSLFAEKSLYSLILILCATAPFIIGKLVKYETLKKYTVVQILCFTASLATLILIL